MSTTYSAHNGYGFQVLRAALHLPRHSARPASTAPVGMTFWLERLALWAERQPMHHRLGSYTRQR
jgi:hypothetical protein